MQKARQENNWDQWVMVAGLFLVLAMTWGIVFNAMSVFVTPLQEAMKTTRSMMLIVMVVKGVASVLASVAAGRLMNRFGALRVMRCAVVILLLSYVAMGFMKSVAVYAVLSFIQVSATILCGFLPASVIINEWFPGKNAAVMGAAYMGSGFGGMLFNFLGGFWISLYGWQNAIFFLGASMAAVVLPITFLILKAKDGPDQARTGRARAIEGTSLEEALQTRQMWMIMAALMVTAVTLTGMINNLTPAFQDLGYTLRSAALITSGVMIAMSLGKILNGWVFDRLGLRVGSWAANLFMLISLIGLIFGHTLPGLLLVILGFTLGGGFASMSVPLLTDGLYGRKDYARISGYLQAAFNIGSILGPLIMSPLYGLFGSYQSAWILFVVLLCSNFMIYFKFLPAAAQQA